MRHLDNFPTGFKERSLRRHRERRESHREFIRWRRNSGEEAPTDRGDIRAEGQPVRQTNQTGSS